MDDVIKVIDALGRNWILTSIVLLLVILLGFFLSYKKAIEAVLKNKSVRSVKLGEAFALDFSKQEKETDVERLIEETSVKSVEVNSSIDPIEKKIEDENSDLLYKAILALTNERDFDKADKLFERWIAEQGNDFKVYTYYAYQNLKFENGDINAHEKILKKIEEQKFNKDKASGFEAIGNGLKKINAFEKAIPMYMKASELFEEEQSKALIYNNISECYYGNLQKDEAVKFLIHKLNSLQSDTGKATVLKGLAEHYGKVGDKLFKSILLDKALEYIPNDTSLIFDAAYTYSESSNKGLSLLHYKSHIFLNSTGNGAYNNIGIIYDELELPILSINSFKKAAKLGNDLASGNLAFHYIEAGMIEDAQEVIDAVNDKKDVNARVISANNYLQVEKQEQTKKEGKLIEAAKKKQRYYRSYAAALTSLEAIEEKILGSWHTAGSKFNVTVIFNGNELILKWIDSQNIEQKITATFLQGLTGRYTLHESKLVGTSGILFPSTPKTESPPLTTITTFNGMFYLENDKMHFFSFKEDEIEKEVIILKV